MTSILNSSIVDLVIPTIANFHYLNLKLDKYIQSINIGTND